MDWEEVRSEARAAADAKRRAKEASETARAGGVYGGLPHVVETHDQAGAVGGDVARDSSSDVVRDRRGREEAHDERQRGRGSDGQHGGDINKDARGRENRGGDDKRELSVILECMSALRASLKDDLTTRLMAQAAAKDDIDRLTHARDVLLDKLLRIGQSTPTSHPFLQPKNIGSREGCSPGHVLSLVCCNSRHAGCLYCALFDDNATTNRLLRFICWLTTYFLLLHLLLCLRCVVSRRSVR